MIDDIRDSEMKLNSVIEKQKKEELKKEAIILKELCKYQEDDIDGLKNRLKNFMSKTSGAFIDGLMN